MKIKKTGLIKPHKWQISMYMKISLSFLGLMIALLATIAISNALVRSNMNDYMQQRQEERLLSTIDNLEAFMEDENLTLDSPKVFGYLMDYSNRNDLKLQILDENHELVFMSDNIKPQISGVPDDGNMADTQPFFDRDDDRIVEEELPIIVGEETVGYVKTMYFNLTFLNDRDANLLSFTNTIFRNAMVMIIFLCLVVSFFVARSITKPLKAIGDTAEAIGLGNLKARVSTKTRTKEMIGLTESVNQLALNLEGEEALRRQVTSDMAHEIRTPLTAVRNFLEAFLDGIYPADEENLLKCHGEILRMGDLVDRLKDLADMEAMKLRTNAQVIALEPVIKEVINMVAPMMDDKGIEVMTSFTENAQVNADEQQLKQIILNLLTNAIHYSEEGGHIILTTKLSGNKWATEVCDQGIGIDEEDLPHIFERFYRSDRSRDRSTGGMGIGLTIVKQLVENMGGTIHAESELGVGSCFTFNLPGA